MLGRQSNSRFPFAVLSAALLASIIGVGPAAAAERLVMPFHCDAQGAELRLSPAAERAYAIVGPRQERVVLACASGRPVQCRTIIAQNFTVDCGGRKVAWERIAETIGGRRSSRVWRNGEQLNISMVDQVSGGPVTLAPCAGQGVDGGGDAVGKLVERVSMRPCADRGSGGREMHFALPAGFAPVAHFGARVMSEGVASSGRSVPGKGETLRSVVVAAAAPSEQRAQETRQRLLERTILTEPLPEIGSADAQKSRVQVHRDAAGGNANASVGPGKADGVTGALPDKAAAADEKAPSTMLAPSDRAPQVPTGGSPQRSAWNAIVTPAVPSNDVAAAARTIVQVNMSGAVTATTQRDVMLWLVLTSLFVTAGWMAWARNDVLASMARRLSGVPGFGPLVSGIGAVGGEFAARAGATVSGLGLGAAAGGADGPRYPVAALEAVMAEVGRVVEGLPRAVPLRAVLDDEMVRVRQRISVAKASGVTDDGLIPAPAYRVLMRDMERIRRIGASARESVPAGSGSGLALGSGRLPRTRQEAFDILGLNPNVGEATIKKCVDALRMSWHPDLAHDAADQALREERIKQINVAAELIAGKAS